MQEVVLQYFNGLQWVDCGLFANVNVAWISLGGDNFNYRVVDAEDGTILKQNI